MTVLNVPASKHGRLIRGAVTLGYRCLNIVSDAVTNAFSGSGVELEGIKKEVWKDLSSIYYKYDDSCQKRAFREVLHDINEKISEDKWDNIYKKLYTLEKNSLP